MKKTMWTILGTLTATSLFAQISTNSLPAIPAPVSSPAAETAPAPEAAPAAPATTTTPATPKHRKHHPAKVVKKKSVKPAKPEPSVTLTPGPAQVNANVLVVRGQPGLKGEMVAHLGKDETVTVLEQINLAHHEADEPAQWARISYPTNAYVWISARYVTNGVVSAKKLNLRAGPGENYSVVGEIEQGAQVTQEGVKGEWIKIDPPADAYAFVAAKYLTQQAAPPVVTTAPPEAPEMTPPPAPPVAPTPTPVPEQPPIVTTPPPPPAPETPTVRIVQHEGVVGPVGSLIAPTQYKLYDPKTQVDIDYLQTTSADQDLHALLDDKVIVTGEEGIDPRWPNTPVMAIQSIQVISTNTIKRLDLIPPRQRH